MRKLFFVISALLIYTISNAQILIEDFDYPTNDTIATASKGWLIASGGNTNLFRAISPGLNYNGFPRSGIGNATAINTNGQDIFKNTNTVINTGSIYSAFMMKVDTAKAAGDYFFAFLSQTSTTGFTGRVFIRSSSPGFYRIGVSKFAVGGNESATYSNDSFALGTTYLTVVKYQFNTGAMNNDSVKVFVFSNGVPTSEPIQATVQNLGAINTGNNDAAALGRVCLRQGTAANAPYLIFDGLVVDESWEGLIGLIKPVRNLSFINPTTNSITLNWTKPNGYIDSTFTTIAFIKAQNNINTGTPNISPLNYNADTNFTSTLSSVLPFDNNAKCVYKGDLTNVSIGGLNPSTNYFAVVYVVKDSDSSYSQGTFISGATQALITPPDALTNLSLSSAFPTQTQLGFKWLKNNYIDSTHTILLFAKQGSAINNGNIKTVSSTFQADVTFGMGTKLGIDTNAFCIYNGDGDSVLLQSLLANTTYFISGYVIRDSDTSWSTPASFSVTTKTNTPAPIFNINSNGVLHTTAAISWQLPAGYLNNSQSVLIFAKPQSPIQNYTILKSPGSYTASNIIGFGTKHESDSLATCIYNGDLNSAILRGLVSGLNYYITAYVANTADSVYSIAVIDSFLQNIPKPLSVKNTNFNAITSSSARINWTKDSSYQNNRYSTLVFIKANTKINNSTPTRNPQQITANATFGVGSGYQHDSDAYWVFKGDTNFVTVTNLNSAFTYHVSVWVVEDADSVYCITADTTSGTTQINPQVSVIGEINRSNSITGAADSAGKYVTLYGITHGFNQRNSGLLFLLHDGTGGITVQSIARNFGYTFAEGDSIMVQGIITSNRGLVTISNLDTILLLGKGKPLQTPIIVNQLNESSDNNIIKIGYLKFVTPPTGSNWPVNTQNIRVIKYGTTDTVSIRLISTSALAGTPLPSTPLFNITGIGYQSSTSLISPFNFDGYAILPRSTNDIELVEPIQNFNLTTPINNETIIVNDTVNGSYTFSWNSAKVAQGLNSVAYQFQFDSLGGDFSNPLLIINSGNNATDTFITVSYAQFGVLLRENGITTNQLLNAKWKVVATVNEFTKSSSTINNVQLKNSINTGLKDIEYLTFNMYPNPAGNNLFIQTKEAIQTIQIFDLSGKLIIDYSVHNSTQNNIDISIIDNGIYLVKVTGKQGVGFKKLMIE